MIQLNHPNVLSCLDYLQRENGDCFVVLPLANAGSLEELLQQGPSSPSPATASGTVEPPWLLSSGWQRLSLILGAAEGLEYLHGLRVWHRDIKPGNREAPRPSAVHYINRGPPSLDVLLPYRRTGPGWRRSTAPLAVWPLPGTP